MFFGIIVFGLVHGLCILPVYLSLIPGKQLSCVVDPKVRVGADTAGNNCEDIDSAAERKKSATSSVRTVGSWIDQSGVNCNDLEGKVFECSVLEKSTEDTNARTNLDESVGSTAKFASDTAESQDSCEAGSVASSVGAPATNLHPFAVDEPDKNMNDTKICEDLHDRQHGEEMNSPSGDHAITQGISHRDQGQKNQAFEVD